MFRNRDYDTSIVKFGKAEDNSVHGKVYIKVTEKTWLNLSMAIESLIVGKLDCVCLLGDADIEIAVDADDVDRVLSGSLDRGKISIGIRRDSIGLASDEMSEHYRGGERGLNHVDINLGIYEQVPLELTFIFN